MHRRSILRTIPCDLKQLPIGALEAFVLSRVHGHALAEDLAEVTGLEVTELLRVARHLVSLGALAVDDDKPKTKRPAAPPRRASGRTTAQPAPEGTRRQLVPPAVVPVARKGLDLRSMGIGPREGFVLSQIDGATTTADLGEITGLSAHDLSDALLALEAAGAVTLGDGGALASKAPTRAPTPAPAAPKRPSKRVSQAPPKVQAGDGDAGAAAKSARDLPEADRARISETNARFETLDHYAVLGVESDADGKALRRAYHALAAQFHPDRYFGKALGPLQKTIERIFVRLTLAYDTLSHKGKRDSYDATLPPRPSKRPSAARPPPTRTATERPPPVRTPTPRPPPVKTPTPAPPPAKRPTRKSMRAVRAASAISSTEPLKRMYADKQRRAVQERVDVFVRAATEALDRDDVVAAANHYRLAVQCSDDPALRVALEKTDAKARVRVRDGSLTGARAAEKEGRWGEAAVKYVKAYGAHSEAWIAERAANAMRHEGVDLRRAAQLAELAVTAEPDTAPYRVTLAEIYLDAGMSARAAAEVKRALAISPHDPRAGALSKRIAMGPRE